MTTEHVSVPRELAIAAVRALNECGMTASAERMQAILSRATLSEVPANHRDHLKPEHAERYYVTQEEIDATHPMNTHCDTCPADNVAMILVGERHEKRNLVDLVRTLLLKAEAKPSAPHVVTAELSNTIAGDIAEHLRDKGWSSGGDYQDDFLPDVEIATRAVLEDFATSLPSAVPDGWSIRRVENFPNTICVSNKKAKMGTDWYVNPSNSPFYQFLEAMLAAAPQAGERG